MRTTENLGSELAVKIPDVKVSKEFPLLVRLRRCLHQQAPFPHSFTKTTRICAQRGGRKGSLKARRRAAQRERERTKKETSIPYLVSKGPAEDSWERLCSRKLLRRKNARFWAQVSLDKVFSLAADRRQTATKHCNNSPYWSFCNDVLSR